MATSKTNTNTKTATAEAIEEQLSGLSGGTRKLIAVIANVVTMGATYYGGITIVNMLVTAVATFTTSGFIVFMIAWLSGIAAVIAAIAAGFFVQNMILDGGIASMVSERVSGATSGVRSWFGSKFAGA